MEGMTQGDEREQIQRLLSKVSYTIGANTPRDPGNLAGYFPLLNVEVHKHLAKLPKDYLQTEDLLLKGKPFRTLPPRSCNPVLDFYCENYSFGVVGKKPMAFS